MKAFIDTDILDAKTNPEYQHFDQLKLYIEKTGCNEFYCPPKEYIILGRQIAGNAYKMLQGITEEGFSFFSFLGIRIIMIPPDKVEKYKLLK